MDTVFDLSAQQEIARALESGESLLWSGKPRQGLLLRAADVFMIPFSLLWGGFAVFWEATAISEGAPTFFALWGTPFVLIGLYLIVGRFLVDAKARANTVYGLTSRRAIVISGIFSQTTNSVPLRTLTDISVQERRGGTGAVLFGRPQPLASLYAGMQWPGIGQYATPAFELIPEAKRVHDRVLEAQRTAP